jgi:hypothetical protein
MSALRQLKVRKTESSNPILGAAVKTYSASKAKPITIRENRGMPNYKVVTLGK